ncbi:MAG: L,D-transpeptidase family protein [Mesorhizobium sp.]|nr:L,D-transpeptidase family protein [Mesorhizobium sp.]
MKSSRTQKLALATTALAALMAASQPASAQSLFQLLFGEPNQHQQRPAEQFVEPAQPQRTQPASLPRVSGPSYYDYRPDALVPVDFSAIEVPIEEARAFTPSAGFLVASADGIDPEIVASVERLIAEGEAEDVATTEIEAEEAPEIEQATDAVPTIENALTLDVTDEPASITAQTAAPQQSDEDVVSTDAVESDAQDEAAAAPQPVTGNETDIAAEDTGPTVAQPVEGVQLEQAVETLLENDPTPVIEEASTLDVTEEPAAMTAQPSVQPQGEEGVVSTEAQEAEAETELAQPMEEVGPTPLRLTEEMLGSLDAFELLTEQAVSDAMVAHYSEHPDFIWVTDEGPSAAATQALEVLASADTHGLDPDHYRVAAPRPGASEAELARFEMELSARTLRYMRDVHGGRIDPNKISGYHDLELKTVDFEAELASLASADDVAAHLGTMHPQNEFYRQLRTELEMLRVSEENDIVIELQGLVRPGTTNPEFAKITKLIERDADSAFLAEHGDVLARHRDSDVYASELEPVIRAAQAARNLQVDGVIGPQTARALAGDSVASRIEKVNLALERLRWLPSDLTERFVFLNAPSYRAQYFEDGVEKLNMRAIYGNTSRQTYFFKDRVSYVEFHPFWGVPRSILVNTYLSRLIDDPGYLDRSGFEVTNRNGQRVSSSSIDWGRYGANIPYDVRQTPGPRNALGELKIMFPNRHAIYMHDTPDRHLFDRANRAISNGCVRLDDPRAMAAAVLGWSDAEVAARLDRPHSREDLNVEVPVYVAYFTAFPEAGGDVAFYDDVYDRDSHLAKALDRVESLRTPSI